MPTSAKPPGAFRTSGSRTGGRRSRPSAGCQGCAGSWTRSRSRSGSRSRCMHPRRAPLALMPVNDRYPLEDVLELCREYARRRRRRVFVEYVMLAGVNDRVEQARVLAGLLQGEAFKVNLIPYNPTGMSEGSVAEHNRRLPQGARRRAGSRRRSGSPAVATSQPRADSSPPWPPRGLTGNSAAVGGAPDQAGQCGRSRRVAALRVAPGQRADPAPCLERHPARPNFTSGL